MVPKLTAESVPTSSLHLDPANARKHGPKSIAAIKASLQRFGQQKLLVVNGDGIVVAGNGTLVAARELGWESIDVVRTNLTGADLVAYAIADNRTAELSEWDDDALAKLMKSIQGTESQTATGFETGQCARMFRKLEATQAITDAGAVAEPERPVSQRGDLWELEGHRLLCGDSTSVEDMARLMNGETAVLLATDPPYLVDYQGGNHPQSWVNKPDVKDKHWDDYVDPNSGSTFFADFLRVALAHCTERVPVYQWHASRRQVIVEGAWAANDLLVHQTIIWVKARPVLTRSHYMWQYEPCFYGWRNGQMPEYDRRPAANERNVWSIDQVGQLEGIHPTQKPLEIFERPMKFHTLPGEVCLEPFSGSGSQLVAAERLGRRCFAMEISPAFVDADVLRWQRASGKVARCNGLTYEELALERGIAIPEPQQQEA